MGLAKIGEKAFPQRHMAYVPIFAVALFVTWEQSGIIWLNWMLGAALAVLGGAIRLWSLVYCGRRQSALGKLKQLITGGPYRLVRNPMYVGNIFMGCAFVAMCGLLWFIPVSFVFLILWYTMIIRFEEKAVAEEFGEPYLEYRKRSARWLPRPGAIWALLRRKPGGSEPVYTWPRALVKQRRELLALVPIIGLALLKEFYLKSIL